MADERSKPDANRAKGGVVAGVTNDANLDIVQLRIDAATNRLLVSAVGALTQYAEDSAHTTGDEGHQVLAVRNDTLAALADTDGDYSPLQVDASGALYVNIGSAAITVDSEFPAAAAITDNFANPTTTSVMGMGMVWDGATWDRMLGDSTDGLLVNLGGNNDVTLATLPDTAAGDLAAINSAVSGTLTVGSHAVTNAGTFVVQEDGAALTALQLIDDVVFVDDTATHTSATTKALGIGAVATPTDGAIDANDIGMVAMSLDRRLHTDAQIVGQDADVTIADGGNDISVDNAGTFAVQSTLQTGSNAIGKLAANTGVDIGDVDVTSMPGTGVEDAGETAGGTLVMGGSVRRDTPASSAGTTGDNATVNTDALGRLWTHPAPNEQDLATLATSHVKKYYTAATPTDGIVWSPAAGKRWYITDIFIGVSAASTVTLEDDLTAGDDVVWKMELAANSGWDHTFTTPLFSGEDAVDLIITASAGTVYVTVSGYEV